MIEYLKYIITPIILAILINIIIYSYGINKNSSPNLISGKIIGIIWIILFGLLGYLYYILVKEEKELSKIFVIILFIFCLSYPFLTRFRKDISQIFNIIAFILTFVTTIIINEELPFAVKYITPLLLWTMYVAVSNTI